MAKRRPPPFGRGHKFNVSKPAERTWNGRCYDSKAECAYAKVLHGLIGHVYREVVEQPRLWLGVRENVYVPDFLVICLDGETYYVDVKGMETPKFKRDKKLYQRYGRLPLRVMKMRSNGTFAVVEEIRPGCERPVEVGDAPLLEFVGEG